MNEPFNLADHLRELGFVYVDAVGAWYDPVLGDFVDEYNAGLRVNNRVDAVKRGEEIVGWEEE